MRAACSTYIHTLCRLTPSVVFRLLWSHPACAPLPRCLSHSSAQDCKMMMVVMVALVMVAACQGQPGSQVYNENACSSKGGLCARSEFCPEDGKMEEGLCPKQQADGVECCQKLPTNLTSCGDRGGECVPTKNCGNAPTEDAECPLGQVCCIFVN
ncbi:LOW QUALITY PROTEIN: U-scoloptoxin(19)-Tl1a-like [Scylla paramamosain]|uniref:LOW QUALITY PROTEIN: U-scoloptoxin(19)-Tl1a-like n=1 Tax=Scylla paramamosain TaxID=85552 RepID=UPI0030839502